MKSIKERERERGGREGERERESEGGGERGMKKRQQLITCVCDHFSFVLFTLVQLFEVVAKK